MKRVFLWIIAALILIVMGFGGNTWRNWADLTPYRNTPSERSDRLSAYWRLDPAEAEISAAGAVLLSGCDGVRDNMASWAAFLRAREGRPALILDSHRPRGFDQLESWRLVCAGQVLTGAERAGDLAVALAHTQTRDVTILGASHGGWTVMEFLRLALTREVPPGLTEWPAPPEELLARLDRIVLLYPYCGFMNRARAADWSGAPPMLMISASDDTIVSTPDCLARASELRGYGARIDTRVLEGAEHGFDQQEKAVFSALTYDAAITAQARDLVASFLR